MKKGWVCQSSFCDQIGELAFPSFLFIHVSLLVTFWEDLELISCTSSGTKLIIVPPAVFLDLQAERWGGGIQGVSGDPQLKPPPFQQIEVLRVRDNILFQKKILKNNLKYIIMI